MDGVGKGFVGWGGLARFEGAADALHDCGGEW